MIKKIIVTVLFIIGILVCISILQIILPGKKAGSLTSYNTVSTQLGMNQYKLYIADTKEKQEQGLSGVKKLAESEGMIFNFKKTGKYFFWMKDMMFPLDFIFINHGIIVDIITQVDPKEYPKIYTASVPFDSVIELNSESTNKSEIMIGQKATYTK